MRSVYFIVVFASTLFFWIAVLPPRNHRKPLPPPIPIENEPVPKPEPIQEQEPEPIPEPTWQEILLEKHNKIRRTPLQLDENLTQFAQTYAENMARQGSLNHSNLNFPGRWARRGENIAMGYHNEEAVFQGWWNSMGHRRNMQGHFSHVGFGKARDRNDRLWWCACFGHKNFVLFISCLN